MSWFDEQGFTSAAEARASGAMGNRGTAAPVTTTQPVGQPVPLNTAAPSAPAQATGAAPDLNTIMGVFGKYPPTNEGFLQAVAELDSTFGKGRWGTYLDHPSRLDKIQLPNGQTFDIMVGAGAPGASWNNRPSPEGPSAGAPGALGALGGAIGGNAMAGIDPSYEWRFKEGQKALERSAASKGTLLTGGTLKALAAYGQGLASTEFGNIFDRNYKLAGLGLDATKSAANTGTAYSGNAGNLTSNQATTNTDLTTQAGNAQSAGTAANGTIWGNTIGQLGNILAPQAAGWLSKGKAAGGIRPNSPGFEYF